VDFNENTVTVVIGGKDSDVSIAAAKSTKPTPLFAPVVVAGHELPHRVVMAPMTRSRSTQPGDVPNAMNARYYAQRASAALIVTEASQISPQGKGYSFTPGIYSAGQIAGWRLVTEAVHAAGGRIFLQLWHVGRMSHPDFHDGELPVAPSTMPFDGQVWKVDAATGVGAMVACPTPRALTKEEIRRIVEDFRRAARDAMQAGFARALKGLGGGIRTRFLLHSMQVRWPLAVQEPASCLLVDRRVVAASGPTSLASGCSLHSHRARSAC